MYLPKAIADHAYAIIRSAKDAAFAGHLAIHETPPKTPRAAFMEALKVDVLVEIERLGGELRSLLGVEAPH